MKKRLYLVHCWGGSPEDGWYPWIKQELEERGVEVHLLSMPNSAEPRVKEWVSHLKVQVPKPDDQTFFIGHSVGCQTVLRYLESLPPGAAVGGALLVAPWFILEGLGSEEEWEIARGWTESPISAEKVKQHLHALTAIFSDTDPYVPLEENHRILREIYGAKTVVEKGKGHFSGEEGVNDLPSALHAALEMIL